MTASPKYVTRLFESLDALAAYAVPATYRSGGDSWAGGSWDFALRALRDGDTTHVARSDELLRKFESLLFPTRRRAWRADVAGFAPNVPAHIAGHPASMRRRVVRQAEAAPITVYVDLFISSSFDAEDAIVRGAAALALVRVLAAYRAVTLYVGYATTGYSGTTICPIVRLDTTPLDLAHATFVLCNVAFVRRIGLAVMDRMVPGSSPWPPLRGSLRDVLAQAGFAADTELLIISGGIVSDVTRDPAAWIEARIREAGVAWGEAA